MLRTAGDAVVPAAPAGGLVPGVFGAAARAGGAVAARWHVGLGIQTLGLGADSQAPCFPCRTMAGGRAGERMSDFMQKRVAYRSFVVALHKEDGKLDLLSGKAAQAQRSTMTVEAEGPALGIQAVFTQKLVSELSGEPAIHGGP